MGGVPSLLFVSFNEYINWCANIVPGACLKVLIPYDAYWVDLVRERLDGIAEIIQSDRSVESMLEVGRDAEVIVSGRVWGEFIRKAQRLKMIQAFGAGVDKIDLDAVAERGDIIVCNSHVNADEVAEYAITLLLAAAKNLIIADRAMRAFDWTHRWGGPSPATELRNKACLLLGLGNIGTAIARRLLAFNMTINAVTYSGKTRHPDLVNEITSYKSMRPLVSSADFVILALPLTSRTKGLVNAEFFSFMRPSSILVNVSRGPIIDEAALYDALVNHKIKAAAIDVWWEYPSAAEVTSTPPSQRFPFHELDNIIVTPHRAAYSENTLMDQVDFIVENIRRFATGSSPHNIIDLEKGY